MPVESPVSRTARRIAFIFTGVIVTLLVAWVLSDPRENLATDWTSFDTAADRLFAGEELYRPWTDDDLPYLYPPPTLLLALPLKLFGFAGSFLLSLAFALAVTVVAVRALVARLGGEPESRRAATTVALLNGFVVSGSLIGQYSGLWLLGLAVGLRHWLDDRQMAAGAALSILVLKPNLAVPLIVVLAWSRSWRVLGGMSAGTIGLLAASLPFGWDAWRGFFRNLGEAADLQVEGVAPLDKMITVRSSLATTLDLSPTSTLLTGAWIAIVGLCGVAVLQLWTRVSLAVSLPRAFGAVVLFIVAANPRLYFYDGLLLVLPGLAYWAGASRWGMGPRAMRFSGVALAFGWCLSWSGVWKAVNVLTGPLAAVVLVVWAVESWRTDRPSETVDFPGLEAAVR